MGSRARGVAGWQSSWRNWIKKDGVEGKEATPMHLVLAARYVEGEMDLEEYLRVVLRV